MGKPGKPRGPKPEKPRNPNAFLSERERQTREHLQHRQEKLKQLVQTVAPADAMFLLQGKNSAPFVQEHNIKPNEIQALKSMLEKRSRQ